MSAAERPWQPWERNFSGGRIGVQEQQGEQENWMVLHVESGVGKTTTSLRLSEAWDLALMISPTVKARLFELLAARRRAENALHQFAWADTLSPLLRKIAEEWDCDSSQCEYASDDMGGLSCPRMEREEGCQAIEAAELRQFADALEYAAKLREDGRKHSSENGQEVSASVDRNPQGGDAQQAPSRSDESAVAKPDAQPSSGNPQ